LLCFNGSLFYFTSRLNPNHKTKVYKYFPVYQIMLHATSILCLSASFSIVGSFLPLVITLWPRFVCPFQLILFLIFWACIFLHFLAISRGLFTYYFAYLLFVLCEVRSLNFIHCANEWQLLYAPLAFCRLVFSDLESRIQCDHYMVESWDLWPKLGASSSVRRLFRSYIYVYISLTSHKPYNHTRGLGNCHKVAVTAVVMQSVVFDFGPMSC